MGAPQEPMNSQPEDYRAPLDLPEIRDLLGANGCYHTARANIREVTNGALASRSAKRFHEYASERGLIYYLYAQDEGSSEDESSAEIPPDHFSWIWDIKDSETTSRVWYERPDRWREETKIPGSSGRAHEVIDGGQRWIYRPPDEIFYTADNHASKRKWPILLRLLDLSVLFDYLDPVLMRTTGRRGWLDGRDTLEVEAKPISLDYAPSGLSGVEGADSYIFSADVETGVIPRFAERLDGEEFYVAEFTEVFFDEEFPDGTFRLELPGVKFRREEC